MAALSWYLLAEQCQSSGYPSACVMGQIGQYLTSRHGDAFPALPLENEYTTGGMVTCADVVLALGRGMCSEVAQLWNRGIWQPRTIFGCPHGHLHFLQKTVRLRFLQERNTCYQLSSLLQPSLKNILLSCPPKVLLAHLLSHKAFEEELGQQERWQEHWEDDKLIPILFLGDRNGFWLKCQSTSHCKCIFSLISKYLGRISQAVKDSARAISQAMAAFGPWGWSKCSEAEGEFLVIKLTALHKN